jgi:hypothetical protein
MLHGEFTARGELLPTSDYHLERTVERNQRC